MSGHDILGLYAKRGAYVQWYLANHDKYIRIYMGVRNIKVARMDTFGKVDIQLRYSESTYNSQSA